MRFVFYLTMFASLLAHTRTFADDSNKGTPSERDNRKIVVNVPVIELMAINTVSVQITLTDLSTDDTQYEIYRSRSGEQRELVRSFNAPGSGGLYIILDYPQSQVPNVVWTYSVDITAGGMFHQNIVSATVNTANFNPMTYPVPKNPLGVLTTETSITFGFENPVPNAQTEIYRAPTHEGPFELLATRSGESGQYTDNGLTPGTTYYYTLRGVLDDQVSAFAGIESRTTFKDFKIPEFDAQAMADGSVHITLHDRGLSDVRYELIREGGGSGAIIETFVLPDSGTVVNYVDDSVLPDLTYVYILDVFFEDGGATVGVDTVTTFATEADLGSFYLVDPFSDAEMDYFITDGFVNVFADMSIAVQANELTKSVVFFLNGERSIDNVAPFAVLPDANGDFESLNLPNGEYTLTAIAYPQQNARGTPTDTLTVSFTVHIETCTAVGCFTLVNADTDQDIESIDEGESFIKPANSFFNVRFNPAFNPGSVQFKVNGKVSRVENAPPFALAGDINGDFFPWKAGLAGTYSIEATPFTGPNQTGIAGQPVSISFTIVQPEVSEPEFVIVNADTDEDIQPLKNGDVFVKAPGTNINIRYDATTNPGSVVFRHQNRTIRVENAAPFALGGDYEGNFLTWAGAVVGNHRIDATPYAQDGGKGAAGTTLTVNFRIVDESNSASAFRAQDRLPIHVYPNPAQQGLTRITISAQPSRNQSEIMVEIINMAGEVISSQKIAATEATGNHIMQMEQILKPGVYIVCAQREGSRTIQRLIVK